jgi:hypothetical protein
LEFGIDPDENQTPLVIPPAIPKLTSDEDTYYFEDQFVR